MPPRIQNSRAAFSLHHGHGHGSSAFAFASPAQYSSLFSTSTPCYFRKPTKLRRDFFHWLEGKGAVFKEPPELGTTNYLGQYDLATGEPKENARNYKVPFPMNPLFISTPVVSDELANEIYRRIETGKSIRMVSAELNVSLQRVAAIYRLKSIEKEWANKGIPSKPFLTKAIHSMLPTTPLRSRDITATNTEFNTSLHEPINDLPTYQQTHTQLFIPVSESRSFTRQDAGSAFGIPPADELIPHPELIEVERDRLGHVDPSDMRERAYERERKEIKEKKEGEEKKKKDSAKKEIVKEVGRWAWRLQNVKTGEVGYRYGVPHEDRKRGIVKIPTRVE